jgi:uncharacterized protein (TIGR02453 family)
MASPPRTSFEGFSRGSFDFLVELAANNDRAWFQPRKAEFERLLKSPLEALCVALADRFAAREIPLVADPERSPFRIYRDIRFSKDKSPYKVNLGAGFAWRDGGPGGYFHFQPGEVFAGGGMWHPEPERLAAWRTCVATDPARVHAALSDPAFVATFGEVQGHRLARIPSNFQKDHPDAELLKLTDVTFSRRLSDDEALSGDLPDILADLYADAVPVLRLLAELA